MAAARDYVAKLYGFSSLSCACIKSSTIPSILRVNIGPSSSGLTLFNFSSLLRRVKLVCEVFYEVFSSHDYTTSRSKPRVGKLFF